MRRPPVRSLVPLALVTALAAAACTTGGSQDQLVSAPRPTDAPATTGSEGTAGPLDWSTCSTREERMAGLECATLTVPIDPEEPGGATIDLALIRAPATGPSSSRIGSLVINPGGPGASGLDFLAGAESAFPKELRRRFDLVSFDPRGVGRSSPVRCLDDERKDAQLEGDLSPDTPEELQRAEADQRELSQACKSRNPDLIRHMSTADVAADVDAIRAAVGDDRLNYLGFSYGTSIGAVYASSYPERVRAMVLDGSVSPTVDWRQDALVQATGFERVFQRFVQQCNADSRCPLAPDAAGAVAAARASLDQDPVAVTDSSGTRKLGADQFDYGLATALYDTSTWSAAAQAVANLRDGGAEQILALMDRQTGRQPDGSYDNSSDAQVMVGCADDPTRPDLAEVQAAGGQVEAASPNFGRLFALSGMGCDGFPTAAEPLPTIRADGAPPILVVGTVGDPATPYEWAQRMAAALTSGRLLTYEGEGHTAFLTGGPCVTNAVVGYLVDQQVPAEGTRCPANTQVDPFGGVRDTLVDQLVDSGVPEELATCIVDGMIDQVGQRRFDQMFLENDQEELSRLAQAQSLKCATGG